MTGYVEGDTMRAGSILTMSVFVGLLCLVSENTAFGGGDWTKVRQVLDTAKKQDLVIEVVQGVGVAGFHQINKSQSSLVSFSYDIEEGFLKISQIEKTPEGIKTTYANYLPLERLLRMEERHVSRQNQLLLVFQ